MSIMIRKCANMKKILIIVIALLALTGCGQTTTTMEVADSLYYSVNIKDNVEFILIKEDTSIEEATQIIKDNIEVETNADSYEFDWYGEIYSYETRESIEELIESNGIGGEKIPTTNEEREKVGEYGPNTNTLAYKKHILEHLGEENYDKELTLSYESIQPIELIIDFKKDGETTTEYKQILVCVAKEDIYDVLKTNQIKKIEDLYITIYSEIPLFNSMAEETSYNISQGYVSNIRGTYEVGD